MKITKVFNVFLILSHIFQCWPFRYFISDLAYLKLFYRAYQGEKLIIDKPIGFNAKLQWLKLHDRNPIYTTLSDKYKVRQYVKERIGEEHLIPLYGVWKDPKDINYEKLPKTFVLKCNHDSGSVIVCRDKEKLDKKRVATFLKQKIRKNYYWKSREYNYKNIERCIIAEQLLTDDYRNDLTDYKFFCFNGEPKFVQVDIGRFSNHVRNYYTDDWEFIDVAYGCKNDRTVGAEKPMNYELMKALARTLSKDLKHVRVDFYSCNNQVYFGELTFHHGGGVMVISPKKYDIEWGKYINLEDYHG